MHEPRPMHPPAPSKVAGKKRGPKPKVSDRVAAAAEGRRYQVNWTNAMKADVRRMYPDPMFYVAGIVAHFKRAHGVEVTAMALRYMAGRLGVKRPRVGRTPLVWDDYPGATDRMLALFGDGCNDGVIARTLTREFKAPFTTDHVRRRRQLRGHVRFARNTWPREAVRILTEQLGVVTFAAIAERIRSATGLVVDEKAIANKVADLHLTARDATGDPTMTAVSRELGVSVQALWQWIRTTHGSKGVYAGVYGEGRYRFLKPELVTQLRADFPPVTEPMMLTPEVAQALFRTKDSVLDLVKRGDLVGFRRGARWYVTVRSVEAFRKQAGIRQPLAQTFGSRVAIARAGQTQPTRTFTEVAS